MATFYLDFEGGDDSKDGTTFANRWKTITNGATAARTAPGDTIRIMGSPAPTSLGQNGVWTSQALQATKNITGATNATPISITCTAHGYSTGDTVVITGVGGNTNANGTWEITSTGANTFTLDGSAGNANYTSGGTARLRNNTRVKLASAVTQNIASTGPGRAAWTSAGGANVVTGFGLMTVGSSFKEHTTNDLITINTAFTTGKAAYWQLPSTLDLSGYQQVSFWISTIGDNPPQRAELRLCSDTTGDTVVDTIPIPAIAAAGRWQAYTYDKGSALGSSISSISMYVNTDISTANVSFYFSNIIACKASSAADSLTLTSLIGKNTTGETFWGIQSINGTRVMLDADTNATPTSTSVRGYYGTSETVTTWKRETIKLGPAASSTTALQTIQDSGTDGSPITFSGGWDRTNMTTQNLETWLDGVNGNGYGIVNTSRSFISLTNLAGARLNRAVSFTAATFFGNNLNLIASNNCTATPVIFEHVGSCMVGNIAANASAPFNVTLIANVEVGAADSNNGAVILVNTGPSSTIKAAFRNGSGFGLLLESNPVASRFNDCVFADNASGSIGITATNTQQGLLYFKNCLFSDTTEVSFSTYGTDLFLFSHKHDQVTDNHKIFMQGALISSATDQRKTASGISWKIQPTSTNRNSTWPVTLSLAKVACAANNLVTVKAWMRRDNSGLTMRLVCKGGQIAGVANDVTASVTTTNAWEEETITFTPTETGVVEITAEAWGGTTFSGWVDDLTISQA
jgi:hypothetical protein